MTDKLIQSASSSVSERLLLEAAPGCYAHLCVCCTTDDPLKAHDFSKENKEYRQLKLKRSAMVWGGNPSYVLMEVKTSWELKRL